MLSLYFKRRYRQPIFNVKCREVGKSNIKYQISNIQEPACPAGRAGKYILTGAVLLRKQKEILRNRLKKILIADFIDNIVVLSEWDQGSQEFYCIKAIEGTGCDLSLQAINVYRSPVSYFLRLSKRNRRKYLSTQITADGLPFRLIDSSKDRWLLVQIVDGTIGWIRRRSFYKQFNTLQNFGIIQLSADELVNFVNKFQDKRNFSITKQEFQKFCQEYVGIKYSLGANSGKRIDCSALVQKICYQAFGFLLPKKSSLQRDVILSGGQSQMLIHPLFMSKELIESYLAFCEHSEFGQLVFLLKKNHKRSKHVAIWYDKSKNLLTHSSHGKKGVVIERKEELMREYEEW